MLHLLLETEVIMSNPKFRVAAGGRLVLGMVVAGVLASGSLHPAAAQARRFHARRINDLTGTYRLNISLSDNPSSVADQVTRTLPGPDRPRLRAIVRRRLDAPEELAIERNGRTITLASSSAAPVTFDADGQPVVEQARYGRTIRTVSRLSGNRLDISTSGDRSIDYQVSFEPIDGGRRLRVVRRVDNENLRQPVYARSVYDRISSDARLDMYDSDYDRSPRRGWDRGTRRDGDSAFGVPDGTEIVATLDTNLSTRQARVEDPFTLTVQAPAQFSGARIDGRVIDVTRSGRVAGRADMTFDFERIDFRDGRTVDFDGHLEGIRTVNGDTLHVENRATVEDEGSQTGRTATRTGVGAAIGAVIGAITNGGKGAAIGAAVGGAAGAGSVLVEGRDELDLRPGAEFRIRAGDPR
jgi:hypothetical protein